MSKQNMRTVISAGGIVLNQHNQIAIVSQFGEEWVLPKGKVEEGEDLLKAARREITEETGLTTLKYIKKLGTYEHESQGPHQFNNERIYKIVHMFLFTTTQQKLKPLDKHNPEAKWISIDEITNYLRIHPQTDFLLKYKNTLSSLTKK